MRSSFHLGLIRGLEFLGSVLESFLGLEGSLEDLARADWCYFSPIELKVLVWRLK